MFRFNFNNYVLIGKIVMKIAFFLTIFCVILAIYVLTKGGDIYLQTNSSSTSDKIAISSAETINTIINGYNLNRNFN